MDVFQAVADPVRRELVEVLAGGERSAGELAEHAANRFGLTQPGTSKHLRALRDAGVVASRVDGKRRVYRLRPARVRELADWAERMTRFWDARLDALGAALERETGDPR
ncbi:DNA-binding transcriptional ArsR family regulator [Pseudonocardia eucalypti]|uniref:ArsR/SmtB family transcription factor n=1 Tax=Pseudonocardia eucalypti TaxID=648755 RepID=UPI00184D9CDC|nr:DNA-binding transcriptional ArsR family regulator [Pseudonocardia eucalypti]